MNRGAVPLKFNVKYKIQIIFRHGICFSSDVEIFRSKMADEKVTFGGEMILPPRSDNNLEKYLPVFS